ncbi:MAG: AAA family ATPase [Thermoplasmata archaeon]|nr:AAA family ATPase [Thermoplasmata archaeon]
MIITVSGPPGSGKSTLARALAEKLGYRYFYAGEIFRKEAAERGLTLEEFGKLAEENWDVDRTLDAKLVEEIQKAENTVFDARLAGVLATVNGIPAFKIYVTASADERARRIAGREGREVNAVMEEMLAREKSEAKRYAAIYGYDYTRREVYDIYIDSTKMSAENVLDVVLRELDKRRI